LVGSTNGVFAWDRRVICTIQIWGIGLDWTSSFPPFTPKVNAHKKGREGMTALSNKAIKHPWLHNKQSTNKQRFMILLLTNEWSRIAAFFLWMQFLGMGLRREKWQKK
jgi:hypothetical protein